MAEKIPTGIPQLDGLLDGGLARGSVSCIWVKPGLDATSFAYQIADTASKRTKTFYLLNSKTVSAAKSEMEAYGFKPSKVNFIDAHSGLIGEKPTAKLAISDPKDADEILKDLSVIVKKITEPLIIIDSLSTLMDLTEKEDTSFVDSLKGVGGTVLCLFTEWPYDAKLIKGMRNAFDTIIEVKSVEEGLFFRSYFSVTRLEDKEATGQAIPYRLTKPGGVKIYFPKVLVTGPFNSGKTSFIHTASEKAVSVDRLGTTIALDHGHVKYKDFAVDLFGTPGQQRFDPILKLLGGEALGVVVVVSATDPEGFPRAMEMMKKAKVHGLPVVFAANKSNLRGALTASQVKARMGLQDADIIPLVAKDLTKVQPGIPCELKQEDIEKVLDAVFDRLMKGGIKK